MKKRVGLRIAAVTVVALAVALAAPKGREDTGSKAMATYLLETVKAFRTIYAKSILDKARNGGMAPMENWRRETHGLMLPAQFVKAGATQIKGYELGLIGLEPIYKSNLPKTRGEENALKTIFSSRLKDNIVIFEEGGKLKGLMGDFAIAQSCVDCHNHHPKSPRRDYKMGDLMGALIVRIDK